MYMLDFLIFIALVIYAIAAGFGIASDIINHQTINWMLVGFEILIVLIILKSMGVFERKQTPEKIKKQWKFKNYAEAADYLEKNKPNLQYEQADKERLSILLFFDWVIVDDSNVDELVLERKEIHHMKKMIFRPTNKKSL